MRTSQYLWTAADGWQDEPTGRDLASQLVLVFGGLAVLAASDAVSSVTPDPGLLLVPVALGLSLAAAAIAGGLRADASPRLVHVRRILPPAARRPGEPDVVAVDVDLDPATLAPRRPSSRA